MPFPEFFGKKLLPRNPVPATDLDGDGTLSGITYGAGVRWHGGRVERELFRILVF